VESVHAAEQTAEWQEMAERAKEKRRRKQERRNAKMELKRQIRELSVDANPQDAYPEARRLDRRFILHIGPTNSGKTYDALQRHHSLRRNFPLIARIRWLFEAARPFLRILGAPPEQSSLKFSHRRRREEYHQRVWHALLDLTSAL
jgi:hypothetical protein